MRVKLLFRIFTFFYLVVGLSMLQAQVAYLDYVKEYSKELEPGKDRIVSATDYFKKKTGIDIYVASSYGYNQSGIMEFADAWSQNLENKKGVLLTVNTLANSDFANNVKITILQKF